MTTTDTHFIASGSSAASSHIGTESPWMFIYVFHAPISCPAVPYAKSENLSQCDRALLSDLPADPRPAQKALLLERQSTIFTICPKDSCQQSHKPTFNPGSPIPIYLKCCLGRHFGKRCKQELLRPKEVQGNIIFLPLKPFVYFDPKDWMGSLLSEPGLEAKMDAAWSKTTESKRPDIMRDIFDVEMLQNFKGP